MRELQTPPGPGKALCHDRIHEVRMRFAARSAFAIATEAQGNVRLMPSLEFDNVTFRIRHVDQR